MFTKDKIYETGLFLRLEHVFDQEKHHAKAGAVSYMPRETGGRFVFLPLEFEKQITTSELQALS